MKIHFGNPARLAYQLHPRKQIYLLLRDTEKLDEPCIFSHFSADVFHVTSGILLKVLPAIF